MHPEIAGIQLYYPVNAFAILMNATVLFVLLRRERLPSRGVLLYLLAHASFGVLGAKLYDIVMRGWLGSLSYELAGGYRYPGALIGLLCAAVWFRRLLPRELTLARFFDCWTPGFSLALAIGRFGCFLHGCCYGAVCLLPWGVHYPSGSQAWHRTHQDGIAGWTELASAPVHPLPLYSMTLELSLFAFLLWFFPRRRFDGQVLLLFLAIHGVGKSAFEFLRYDYSPLHQTVFPIGLIASGVLLVRWIRDSGDRSPDPSTTAA